MEGAFSNCPSLDTIYFSESEEWWNNLLFRDGTNALQNVTVYFNHGEHTWEDDGVINEPSCTGDGVIVATPTGSTAYSLSAGGPMVEPETDSILITPICAHDMSSRCMVTSDKRVITVEMTRNARRNAYVSVDGGKALRMNVGDVATIRKANRETKLIRLKDRSFYDVIGMKFKDN